MKKPQVRDLVVISDTHVGSTLALCPPKSSLDDGGGYIRSKLQITLWNHWTEFWKWTYKQLQGRPFVLIHNGDIIDGVHHKTTTLVSHNLSDQKRLAVAVMRPHVDRAEDYYQIRGTEAHVGQSATTEEDVAETLKAVIDPETGRHSRYELWVKFGPELIHFAHHIGTTSSTSYESSAPMREIVAAFVEAGQWNERPPSMLVRSHRHRYIEVKPPNGRIVVTPAFQAKTPFVFKIDRMRAPMFGGLIIKLGDEGVHVREWVRTLKRPEPVTIA